MRSRTFILICFALAVLLPSCEDQWGNTATMGYVVDIVDDGNGKCTYYMSSSPDDKTHKHSMVTSCGLYKLGEGFFIPQ